MKLNEDLRALVGAQMDWTGEWHEAEPEVEGGGLGSLVKENHRCNFTLWHEEDEARRDDLGAEHVRRAKRAIDRMNQLRNNAIERIDAALLELLPEAGEDVPLHSETPGMILDRLSILALKIYHMKEQTERSDVEEAHRRQCAAKLEILRQQRNDLAAVLEEYAGDLLAGRRRFKVYYQMKMYNDPKLNPKLYGKP